MYEPATAERDARRRRGRDRQGPRERAARPRARRRPVRHGDRRRRRLRGLGHAASSAGSSRSRPPSCARRRSPAGSMGPKVEAAVRFVERTGQAGGDRRARATSRRSWTARPAPTSCRAGEPEGAEAMMATFGVHSEVGKLRKVMVHRPELSLQRLTPANHDELLFDDVLWVERAQYEHDQFVARMRERGVEVFLLRDLLAEALAAERRGPPPADRAGGRRSTPSARRSSTRSVRCSGRPDAGRARQAPDRRPDGRGVGHRPRQALRRSRSLPRPRSTTRATFILPPLPNTLFTRDSSCWIYGGVSINPMYWPARRLEAYNVAAIYRAPPDVPRRRLRVLVSASSATTAGSTSRTSAGRRSRAATCSRSATARC